MQLQRLSLLFFSNLTWFLNLMFADAFAYAHSVTRLRIPARSVRFVDLSLRSFAIKRIRSRSIRQKRDEPAFFVLANRNRNRTVDFESEMKILPHLLFWRRGVTFEWQSHNHIFIIYDAMIRLSLLEGKSNVLFHFELANLCHIWILIRRFNLLFVFNFCKLLIKVCAFRTHSTYVESNEQATSLVFRSSFVWNDVWATTCFTRTFRPAWSWSCRGLAFGLNRKRCRLASLCVWLRCSHWAHNTLSRKSRCLPCRTSRRSTYSWAVAPSLCLPRWWNMRWSTFWWRPTNATIINSIICCSSTIWIRRTRQAQRPLRMRPQRITTRVCREARACCWTPDDSLRRIRICN